MPRRSPAQTTIGALVVAVILFALQAYLRTAPAPAPRGVEPAGQSGPSEAVVRDAPRAPQASGAGFRSRAALEEHFRKHGGEFGGRITIDEYLRRAQRLRDAAGGGPVLEVRRADGVVTRFDRSSGDFVAFNSDKTIRTFFRPNDGEAYFRRQAQRDDE